MKLAEGNKEIAKLSVWGEKERLTATVISVCSGQSAVLENIQLLLQVLSN